MSITRAAIAAALALSVAGLAGCTSDGSGDSTGLAAAMAQVPGSAPARLEFQYGDFARMRELGILDPSGDPAIDKRWYSVVGYGTGPLASALLALPEVTGLKVLESTSAQAIGRPPFSAVRISGGIDRNAVTAKLKALGAKPRRYGDTDGLSLGGDNQAHLDGALVKLGIVTQFNQMAFSGDSFLASPNSATLQQVLGGDTSLAETPGYGDLADCLGDVVAADIVQAGENDTHGAVYAVGVRDPGSKSGTDDEVVCVLPRAGQSTQVTAALKKNLALTALDPRTKTPLSHYATKSQVGQSGKAVQVVLTMKADTRVGYVLAAVATGQLALWAT